MLKAFLALPLKYKLMTLRCWFSFLYWHVVIAYLPYRFWKHNITTAVTNKADVPIFEVRHLIRMTESVGRHHIVQVNCLRRCMVQKALLGRMGIAGTLVFGVKKKQNNFAAHCWLTYQNQIINDSLDTTTEYVALEQLGDNPTAVFEHLKSSKSG